MECNLRRFSRAASGRLGTLDGEPPLRLRVNRLGLKKKICWWKYANAD